MRTVKPKCKMRGWESDQRYVPPGVQSLQITDRELAKPPRASKRELLAVLQILQRVAAGGDATTAVDAAALIPIVHRAVSAAPPGRPNAIKNYTVTLPNGTQIVALGLRGAAAACNKAVSTVANALTTGGGKAEFSATDDFGNPAVITVVRGGNIAAATT